MKYSEITAKSEAELKKDLESMRAQLAETKVKIRLSQVTKLKDYKTLRKDIARIMTALSAKANNQ